MAASARLDGTAEGFDTVSAWNGDARCGDVQLEPGSGKVGVAGWGGGGFRTGVGVSGAGWAGVGFRAGVGVAEAGWEGGWVSSRHRHQRGRMLTAER